MLRECSRSAPLELIRAGGVPEVRADRRLCFYAATFDVETTISENGQQFREVIRAGAFRDTLASGADVVANLEHDNRRTFAKRSGGLLLQEDARGLFASVYLGESAIEVEALEGVRSGRFRGCSFKFRVSADGQRVTPGNPLPLVELLRVDVLDVCLTANPAYPQTVVSLRGRSDRERRLRLQRLLYS